MLRFFRSVHTSPLWWALSIACAMITVSYICFEVLDLDGSSFSVRHLLDNTAVVSEIETNIERPHLTRLAEPWTEASSSWLFEQLDWVHPRPTEPPKQCAVDSQKRCGYRTALPRSSVPDHLSFHA
jgi:hypothetical protein